MTAEHAESGFRIWPVCIKAQDRCIIAYLMNWLAPFAVAAEDGAKFIEGPTKLFLV